MLLAWCTFFVSCHQICPPVPDEPVPGDTIPQDTVNTPSFLYVGDYTEDLSAIVSSPFDIARIGIRVGDNMDSVGERGFLLLEFTDTTSAVDYHYLPACWRDVPAGQPLADTVYQYTQRVMQSLAPIGEKGAEGGKGAYVQISRDISHGLLWHTVADQLVLTKPMSANPTAWQNQALYIKAAIRAIRECCPEAKIVLQTSKLGSTESLHEQLPRLISNWAELGIDYDVLSFYVAPAIRSDLTQFESGLTSLFNSGSLSTFDFGLLSGKEFHFETFYPCTEPPAELGCRTASKAGYSYTPSGQRDYLRDWKNIITKSLALFGERVPEGRVRGCFIYRHATSPSYFRLYDYNYLAND